MAKWNELYDDDFWVSWAHRPPLKITLDWIAALRKSGAARIYDMGCGLGRHAVILAKQGFTVVASDTSPRALEATGKALEDNHLKADIICAKMTSIPFPDAYFHAVLSIAVMEHNTKAGMQKAISEIHRVLCGGGKVLASFAPRSRSIPRDEPAVVMLEDNTLRSYGPEESVHHLVDETELRELFAGFVIHSITKETDDFDDISAAELFISAEKP